jgi:hypothetical protein
VPSMSLASQRLPYQSAPVLVRGMITPTLLLLVAILLASNAFGGADLRDVVESPDGQHYSRNAYEAGRQEAERDIRDGRLDIEMYGGPPPAWLDECAKLLRQRYGIRLRDIAGCVVDYQIIGHERGYNEVSHAEILRRFGRDVVEETKTEVKKRRGEM